MTVAVEIIPLLWFLQESYQFNAITPLSAFSLEALDARHIFLQLLKMRRPIDYDLIS